MKNYVKISSTINVSVTSGLQYQNFTNEKSDIPNRLKVSPLWPKMTIDIKQGVHFYPAEIAEWNTVKSLVKDKVLTIGEFVDVCEEQYAIDMKQKLFNVSKVDKPKTSITKKKVKEEVSLENLTEVE